MTRCQKLGRVGLEPTTCRLRAECSTIELTTQLSEQILAQTRDINAVRVFPGAF